MKKNNKDGASKASSKTRITLGLITSVFAENPRTAMNYKQIMAKAGVEDVKLVHKFLDELVEKGIIIEIDRGKYQFIPPRKIITGIVELTQRGAAFVITDELDTDIFIAPYDLNQALNGDVVKVSIYPMKKHGKPEGEIIEILERKKTQYVGTIQGGKNYAFVICDDKRMYTDIFVPQHNLNGAGEGYKVLVDIIEWPETAKNPIGKVVQILGKAGENNTEMHAIVAEFGFKLTYSPQALKEAEEISEKIPAQEIKKRRDFRDTTTFTIDPLDAKDFDDAISVKSLGNGQWEIGVHIADVSHFVTKGSGLDKEAYERGTSVYLVDRTIPMLPEKLSNNVCSLVPNKDRLTFSAVFNMDADGKIYKEWFGKTVIHSDRRFTYEEAQDAIETGKGDYKEEILLLNTIAEKLRDERFRQGAISFETEEVKFNLDKNGKPLGVYKKVRKEAHKLVEDFMLLANKKVAEYVAKSKSSEGKKQPLVYRVHDSPNEDKLNDFSLLAKKFGYRIDMASHRALSRSFNQLLSDVEGKPEQNILQQLAIRTMAKAIYTTKKTSHYGLAFEYYTHFTSPIRRYPDLIVHRNLFAYLNNKPGDKELDLEEAAKHSSMMEQKAVDAERASVKYKQAEYLETQIGRTFDAVISGVTEWGIFAEIIENKCEGMIRVNSLDDDFYVYDERENCIIGKRTHRKYTLGDVITVKVKKTDVLRRTIDLILVQKPGDRSNIDHSFDFVSTPGYEKSKRPKSEGQKSHSNKSQGAKSRGAKQTGKSKRRR